MDSQKLIIGIGFVLCLPLIAENETAVSTIETPPDYKTVLLGKNVRPKSGLVYSYPTPLLLSDLHQRYLYSEYVRRKEYYGLLHPVFAFGLENFLSYAAHFCRYETDNGLLEVVSVGSGNGTIENDIIAAYSYLFGELSITLVDPNPAYRVDFRTVDDLIAKRANAVRNCILLIIYPVHKDYNDGYDIAAIRKLQPRAVLTMYEITGVSGSLEFLACLHSPGFRYAQGKNCSSKLDNYVIDEIAYQEVNSDPELAQSTAESVFKFRLMKLQRTN